MYQVEMNIVIYCDELIERKDSRKAVNRKGGMKGGKTKRKEKQSVKTLR